MYQIGQKLYCSELQRVGRLIKSDGEEAFMLFIVNGEKEIINVDYKSLISPKEIKDFIEERRICKWKIK